MRADRRRRRLVLPVVAGGLAALTVLAQISYPLAHGAARVDVTIVMVLLFAATSVAHAAATRGWVVAIGVLAVSAALGLTAEIIGQHTGVPFGRYTYRPGLGPRLADVPLVVGLAWTMFAWPAAVVGLRLGRSYVTRAAIGAVALASWDLYLDPQQVAAGFWRWRFPAPHLPGVPGVPLTNFAGWALVSAAMSLVLQAILAGRRAGDDRLGYGLFLWTWLSSALALSVFLDLAGAAVWGLVGMGLVAGPLAATLRPSLRRLPWASAAS
jgi:putative membrane protein